MHTLTTNESFPDYNYSYCKLVCVWW